MELNRCILSRADVERILGQPKDENGRVFILENEWVSVSYSDGTCNQESKDWDVPKDIVLSISVHPKRRLFSELRVDVRKFKKTNEHLLENFYYENEEDGIMYVVNHNYITAVIYFPTAKDKRLLCNCSK